MRADGGYDIIIEAIKKLGKVHKTHMAVYGKGNEDRLTGKHETAIYSSVFVFFYCILCSLWPHNLLFISDDDHNLFFFVYFVDI